jgi:hypothetical protein
MIARARADVLAIQDLYCAVVIHASSHFATDFWHEQTHIQRQTWKRKLLKFETWTLLLGSHSSRTHLVFRFQSHIYAMASQLLPLGESLHRHLMRVSANQRDRTY